MLAPHELKNKEFTKSLRGYSTEEVDEHIAFIIEKYTDLYRENDALEKKLKLTEARLDSMKSEEDSIRSALVNAQKASKSIIDEANEQADVIIRSAKTNCDRLITEMKKKVAAEQEKLDVIREETKSFKAALFEVYGQHISMIEAISPEAESAETNAERIETLTKLVTDRIREDLDKLQSSTLGGVAAFEEKGETDEKDADITVPAEVVIPDNITEPVVNVTAVRDDDQISFDEIAVEENGDEEQADGRDESLIDSIRRINGEVNRNTRDDDEEFLRLLRMASGNGDLTSTEAFEMAYDGKRKD